MPLLAIGRASSLFSVWLLAKLRTADHFQPEPMASRTRARQPLDGVDPAEEHRVSEIISSLRALRSETPSTQVEIDARIEAARSIITSLNATPFMTWSDRYDDQTFVIAELQNLAYHEADGGGSQDIAQWCIRQYLQIINQSREDPVEALSGMPTLMKLCSLFDDGASRTRTRMAAACTEHPCQNTQTRRQLFEWLQ